MVKRQKYRGYIIDTDSLGRLYVYDTASPYSEDCDKKYVHGDTLADARGDINVYEFCADVNSGKIKLF